MMYFVRNRSFAQSLSRFIACLLTCILIDAASAFASTENKESKQIQLMVQKDETEICNNTLKSKKPKIIFFFTSWCMHCKRAFSELLDTYEKYKSSVDFLALSLDSDLETIKSFLAGKHSEMKVYTISDINRGKLEKVFNDFNLEYTGAVPHIALLSTDNKVLIDNTTHMSYVESTIERSLNEKKK